MRTHKDNVPLISWGWAEGRLWDMWMLVHFLSGATIASVLQLSGVLWSYAWIIALVVLTLWEFAEIAFGIKEEEENLVIDIVVGMVGFFVFSEYVHPTVSVDGVGWVSLALFAGTALLSVCGWWSYQKRSLRV